MAKFGLSWVGLGRLTLGQVRFWPREVRKNGQKRLEKRKKTTTRNREEEERWHFGGGAPDEESGVVDEDGPLVVDGPDADEEPRRKALAPSGHGHQVQRVGGLLAAVVPVHDALGRQLVVGEAVQRRAFKFQWRQGSFQVESRPCAAATVDVGVGVGMDVVEPQAQDAVAGRPGHDELVDFVDVELAQDLDVGVAQRHAAALQHVLEKRNRSVETPLVELMVADGSPRDELRRRCAWARWSAGR